MWLTILFDYSSFVNIMIIALPGSVSWLHTWLPACAPHLHAGVPERLPSGVCQHAG